MPLRSLVRLVARRQQHLALLMAAVLSVAWGASSPSAALSAYAAPTSGNRISQLQERTWTRGEILPAIIDPKAQQVGSVVTWSGDRLRGALPQEVFKILGAEGESELRARVAKGEYPLGLETCSMVLRGDQLIFDGAGYRVFSDRTVHTLLVRFTDPAWPEGWRPLRFWVQGN